MHYSGGGGGGGGGGSGGGGGARPPAPPEGALGNALFARACGFGARGGWLEVEAAAALCVPACGSPERMQGLRREPHRSWNQEPRTRLAFHVKAGDAGAVARLMDEGGEEAWAPAGPPLAGGGPPRARAWREELFAPVAAEEGAALRPAWRPEDHAASVAALRERAPGGGPWVMPLRADGAPDFGPVIKGPLAVWRAANLGAEVANVNCRDHLTDADFVHLAGVKALDMSLCPGITDAGLAHLRGIHTLNMRYCSGITDAGLAHLTGIHTLNMRLCHRITDAGLARLAGIHTLDMRGCSGIHDAGLAHLAGIHTINMGNCSGITDAGLAHLRGIHTLNMGYCRGITDAGFAHLRSIHTLVMSECTRITDAGLAHLAGIHTLHMSRCNPATIAAARARGLI
jgi:hypothetical protein